MLKKRTEAVRHALQALQARERTAVEALAQVRRQAAGQEAQLHQLAGYRDEYRGQLYSGAQAYLDAGRLNQRAAFVDSLNRAVSGAQDKLSEAHRLCQQQRDSVARQRQKTRALQAVLENLQRQQQRLDQRREQAELDDWVNANRAAVPRADTPANAVKI